ncbi:hypothetical protein MMC28_002519 [Mycoblastus sanguinarius]|nr:hypothetical protein [Mycoblastus sanguinarius]
MWVDAICINQDDLEERSQQVLLMREIYSKSSGLFVWLGEDINLCGTAFDYILNALDEFGYPPGPDVHNTSLVKELVEDALMNLTDEVSSSLDHLFSNSWFRRAWTFQEILCASEPEVFAGDRSIPYEDVVNFVQLFCDFGLAGLSSNPLAKLAMGQIKTMRAYRDRPTTLLELAAITRPRDATDPRDKLYSLTATASDSAVFPYQPNYHVAVNTLYKDFTVAWIAEYEGINVLDLCVYVEDNLERPSWVPNFADSKHIVELIDTLEEHFEACGPCDESKKISIRNDTLSTPGLLLESIAISASRSLNIENGQVSILNRIAEGALAIFYLVREAYQMAFMSCWNVPESIRTQAFWRTLLGGNWIDNCRLRQHHEANFNSYWEYLQQFDPDGEPVQKSDDYDLFNVNNLDIRVTKMARGRRFCMSESGRMGWIPEAGKKGDVISVLYGSFLPVLLRPKGKAYEVIGTCYIHGIMDGEAVAAAQEPMQQIELV